MLNRVCTFVGGKYTPPYIEGLHGGAPSRNFLFLKISPSRFFYFSGISVLLFLWQLSFGFYVVIHALQRSISLLRDDLVLCLVKFSIGLVIF